MIFLFQLWAIVMALSVIILAAQWIGILTARLPITGFSLFSGLTIARFPMFGGNLNIGCIPWGFGIEIDETANLQLGWGPRVSILLAPVISLLAFAGFVLGWPETLHHFGSGFWQLPLGAWAPMAEAPHLIAKWHAVLSTRWIGAAAILATKYAAFMLLPLAGPIFPNFLAVLGEKRSSPELQKWAMMSALLGMGLVLLWSFSSAFYVFSRAG